MTTMTFRTITMRLWLTMLLIACCYSATAADGQQGTLLLDRADSLYGAQQYKED